MSIAGTIVGNERLGRYELLGELASGGMATVFLGRVVGAKGFQRLVAIKRLHPHLEAEEDFVSMFLDEARLAARIRHPNCVATLDVEDEEGLYIVMEYIEGDRLLSMLRHANKTGERIPPPIAMRIALDTLAGLNAAHELLDDDGSPLGLVHRDVSPQNILIGIDGVARLTDFGIAKATARLSVTRDGQLKGKIAYMAPEQTKKVEIDRRVDLFAMGIIVWEMLTAKKLFTGDTDVEVLNQLLFEPVPRLKDHAPGIPAALDAAVMKALERDPTKRYRTALEFSEALEKACRVFGGPANPRTVAQLIQRVSADKLARDRARIQGAAPPDATNASAVRRRTTVTGLAAYQAPIPEPAHEVLASSPAMRRTPAPAEPIEELDPEMEQGDPTAQYAAAPAPPVFDTSMSLVDDEEEIPTKTLNRDGSKANAATNAPSTTLSGTGASAGLPSFSSPDDDEEPVTSQHAAAPEPAPLMAAVAAPPPSASVLSPVKTTEKVRERTTTEAIPTPTAYTVPAIEPKKKSPSTTTLVVGGLALVLFGAGGGLFLLGRNAPAVVPPVVMVPTPNTATPPVVSPPTNTTPPVVANPVENPRPNQEQGTGTPPTTPEAPPTNNTTTGTTPSGTTTATANPPSNGTENPPANTPPTQPAAQPNPPPTRTNPTSHAPTVRHNPVRPTTPRESGNTTRPANPQTNPSTGTPRPRTGDPFGDENPYQQ